MWGEEEILEIGGSLETAPDAEVGEERREALEGVQTLLQPADR